jgi:hypothetical protein
MARHTEKPANCTEVTLYSGLEWYAQGWLKHTIGNLIIVGPTSIGKSETIKKVVVTSRQPNHLLLQGVGSGVKVYQQIHEWVINQHNDGPIIVDDGDPIFHSLAGQTLGKELVLDKPDRPINWNTDYNRLRKLEVPTSFTISNPVCILLNKWRTFNEHLAAVKSRGKLIFANFSAGEVHNYVGTWFLKSREAGLVYEFDGRFLPLMRQPNIREYYEDPLKELLTEYKLGRPNPEGNWQRMIMKKLVKPNELEAALLFCDDYPSNAARAKAFVQMGLGSARTFYRQIKRLKLADRQECEKALAALEAEEERQWAEEERLKTAIMVKPA